MKITMHELLQWADEEKFGVIAFNYSDIWDLLGIIKAAEAEHAPVMVMSVPPVVENIGIKYLYGMCNAAAESAKVPVVPHLDHSFSPAMCFGAVDTGYRSIMIDASMKSLEENIQTTKKVVDYAHRFDCFVEGELGRIRGSNCEGVVTDESKPFLTEVEDARRFVAETGVDSLAIGIGNAHGFYTERPNLNIRRLAEINEAVDTKLVLHGGTGIPAETVREAIKNGINKINVGTIIFNTHMKTLKASLNSQEEFDLKQHNCIIDAVAEVAREWIRVSMSNGRV
ncbi:MAG TPA: class II fructose-bisphosphate aldolase [Candidatus Pullichristensenella excrementigallinarum]|uniref:Class II fructose-bisphosphate aldolase n=1 Tax=Candidatus Pullichristensenella excrementigallinarum TaxID=2840907 RepID=A0A9D1IEK8_9FIRM|nr:class II fructose-bisphosphate aldolase [Candidatus Pullichristensenella excrementigallinarum]